MVSIDKIEGKRVDLLLEKFVMGNDDKGYPPAFMYNICLKSGELIGEVSAKIGYNDILYYAGHTGFSVNEDYRGNGYAVEAVNLVKQVFKANGMNWIYITNNPDNQASIRVCEKVGARFLKLVEFSEDDLRRFAVSDSFKNIWELKF